MKMDCEQKNEKASVGNTPIFKAPPFLNIKSALIGQVTHAWACTANENRVALQKIIETVVCTNEHAHLICITVIIASKAD